MNFTGKKAVTLSHYEVLVLDAVRTLTAALDEALDLDALASPACMAPLHFHRVFRGLVGETPLQLHRRLRLFGYNRANLWSLFDRDYDDAGRGVVAAYHARLAEAGLPRPATARLVTQLRTANFVFNPVSFFCGYDGAGQLTSVIADVRNTYGGRHRYLLGPARKAEASTTGDLLWRIGVCAARNGATKIDIVEQLEVRCPATRSAPPRRSGSRSGRIAVASRRRSMVRARNTTCSRCFPIRRDASTWGMSATTPWATSSRASGG